MCERIYLEHKRCFKMLWDALRFFGILWDSSPNRLHWLFNRPKLKLQTLSILKNLKTKWCRASSMRTNLHVTWLCLRRQIASICFRFRNETLLVGPVAIRPEFGKSWTLIWLNGNAALNLCRVWSSLRPNGPVDWRDVQRIDGANQVNSGHFPFNLFQLFKSARQEANFCPWINRIF